MDIELNSEHRKDETNCQRAGVTHENLGVFLDIAEHIIIEERHEHAGSGKEEAPLITQAMELRPDARPSIPSIRLIALIRNTITIMVKG